MSLPAMPNLHKGTQIDILAHENIDILYDIIEDITESFQESVTEVIDEDGDDQGVTLHVHEQSISLVGTSAGFEILSTEFTVVHSLDTLCLVTVSLDDIQGESGTARFLSWGVLQNDVNQFVARITGVFLLSVENLLANVRCYFREGDQ